MPLRTYNLAIVGFGNVGRTFVSLLDRKAERLASDYNLRCMVTGIASRKLGWLAKTDGFDPAPLLDGNFQEALSTASIQPWLAQARPDAVFETTSLNPQTGEPAIQHLRDALEYGAHAISANKGPVVYAYEGLTALAARKKRKFYFESSVMDGAPVFNLFRECLPAVELRGFRGILNSTTNVILEAIGRGQLVRRSRTARAGNRCCRNRSGQRHRWLGCRCEGLRSRPGSDGQAPASRPG